MGRRAPGRPRKEQEALDIAFVRYGGVRTYFERLVAAGASDRQIAEIAEREGGVRIHPNTVYNWLREWREADGKEAIPA